MCKYCEYGADECEIFQDGLTGDFYYNHCTYQWDDYNDDYIYDRVYISYCPWCGRELEKETIKIKYFDNEIDHVEKISNGDLIDLRAAETVEMKKGEYKLIRLGVGMKLPNGYKANVYPRSSTPNKFGIMLANSVGQIDNSYSGDEDEWKFPAYAIRDTIIHKNDRICQFEIQKIQPTIEFVEVEHLDEESRGGIGSTGVN